MSASDWSLMEIDGNNKEVPRPEFINLSAIMTLGDQCDATVKQENMTTAVHMQRHFQ